MAESCENLDNILRGWAKDKVQKGLSQAFNSFEKQEEKNLRQFLLQIDSEKKYSSSLSRQSSDKTGVGKLRTTALSRI